ncbi:hypothetical protein HOLleu_22326 [Holothuria leucospilota]|uniref:Uncharacterized protein n=1 Tax=Holothuria leucospilota TaxID=206669 RepID=A0A9Q1BYW4_HOLLE|nr:hypothetical protein HOLleu_22326 [Holothuria leucospilota]
MDIVRVSDFTLRGAKSRATLGVIEVSLGGLGIVVEMIFYLTYRRYHAEMYFGRIIILQMVLGIVNCLLLVVAGVLGICSQRKLWVVIVNMVVNIISACVCITWGVFLGAVTSQSWSYRWYDWHPNGFYLVTLSFLDVALLLNFLTAVIGASFTCTAFCPCAAVNTEGQLLLYNNAFRITPHNPPLHDEATSPQMEPNLDPPCAGISSFKATSYGAV